MVRLTTLMVSNNRIAKIDPDLAKWIPNLAVLVMNNNQLSELGDLVPLENLVQLKFLSLLDNPVIHKKYYREFVIHKCPRIRVLDFQRVTDKVIVLIKERMQAVALFSGVEGSMLLTSLVETKSTIDLSAPGVKKAPTPYQAPSKEEIAKIREAIKNAKTLEEVSFLEKALQRGTIPDD